MLLLVEQLGEVLHRVLLERIVRHGRKAGVAVVGAAPSPVLGAFGGSEPLRTAMLATNVAVFRTSRISRSLVPRLAGDPSQVPQWFADGSPAAGIGYLANDRPEPFRAWSIPEADTDRLLTYAPPAASWRPTPAAGRRRGRGPPPAPAPARPGPAAPPRRGGPGTAALDVDDQELTSSPRPALVPLAGGLTRWESG